MVPRAYLRNFADDDRMIGMRLVDDAATERVVAHKGRVAGEGPSEPIRWRIISSRRTAWTGMGILDDSP